MLQPKRTKYRKMQKGRMKGLAHRGSNLDFGSFSNINVLNAFFTF